MMMSFLGTPRSAIMATFAGFGAVVGTFAGSVPQMIANHGVDEATYGIGVTAMTAATVASMGISGTLARFLSHRSLLLLAMPCFLVLCGLLLATHGTLSFFVLAILFGISSGIVDVIMNAEGGAIERQLRKPIYTAFHGSVSLSLAFFAIASSLISTHWGTTASVALASVVVVIAMVMVALNLDVGRVRQQVASSRASGAKVFTPKLVLIGAAAGLIISCEVTALFWSSSFLAEGAPQLASIAGMGAALFGLANAVMRFSGDWLRTRFDEIRLMSGMIIMAIIGFAGLALTSGFAANLAFFALVGFGLAILCPCLFARAGLETPGNPAASLSVAMLVAGIPRIAMPTLVGAVSDLFSTRFAFVLCAIALVGALAVIRLVARHDLPAATRAGG